MNDEMLMETEEQQERFVIDSDEKADWAIEKINEHRAERDRLLDLIDRKSASLKAQREEVLRRYDSDTEWLRGLLAAYMQTVKCKQTKTQQTYQLCSGKLVLKRGTLGFKRDEDALIKCLIENNMDDFVKVDPTVAWGELKKRIVADEVNGICMDKETGLVIEGVYPIRNEDVFEVV